MNSKTISIKQITTYLKFPDHLDGKHHWDFDLICPISWLPGPCEHRKWPPVTSSSHVFTNPEYTKTWIFPLKFVDFFGMNPEFPISYFSWKFLIFLSKMKSFRGNFKFWCRISFHMYVIGWFANLTKFQILKYVQIFVIVYF